MMDRNKVPCPLCSFPVLPSDDVCPVCEEWIGSYSIEDDKEVLLVEPTEDGNV